MNYPKWLPQDLNRWLDAVLAIVAIVCISGCLGTAWYYEAALGPLAVQTLKPMPETSKSLHDGLGSAKDAVEIAKQKVSEIDIAPINASLRNVRDATGNLKLATSHANSITAAVDAKMPEVGKAMFDLWKHTDRSLGHLDHATQQEEGQQKNIAESTIKTMNDLDKVVTDPNITMAISHVQGTAANLDSTTKHVDHVADHIDHTLTAPKRWWQKLEGWSGTAISVTLKFFTGA